MRTLAAGANIFVLLFAAETMSTMKRVGPNYVGKITRNSAKLPAQTNKAAPAPLA